MPINDFLVLFAQALFLIIAILTWSDFLRSQDHTRFDIALLFSSIAIAMIFLVTAAYRAETGYPRLPWLDTLGFIAIAAEPFLLLRLVCYFRSIPVWTQRLASVGLLLTWIILLAVPSPRPVWLILLAVLYFILVQGYASLSFVWGAQATRGVTRGRLILAAAGSGLFAGVILCLSLGAILSEPAGFFTAMGLFLLVLAPVSYYLGFATPRWLRRAWQLAELHRFLHEMAGRPTSERAGDSLSLLCRVAMRAVGGRAAAIAQRDERDRLWLVQIPGHDTPLPTVLTGDVGLIDRSWHERQPVLAHLPADLGTNGARLAALSPADAVYIAPIATPERAWGLVLVFMVGQPLFPADDLDLLRLLAEQSASTLYYAALLEEQRTLIDHMRANATRTKALGEVSQAFAEASLDTQIVSTTVVKQVAELMGDACVLHLLSIDGQSLNPVAYHHPDPEAVVLMRRVVTEANQGPGEGLSGQVVQSGQSLLIPVITPDQVRTRIKPNYWPFVDRFGVYSLLYVPLRAPGRVIGALGVLRTRVGQPYGEDDRDFLQALADRAALAIENARLFEAVQAELAERRRAEEELRRQNEYLAALHETTVSLINRLNVEELLEDIVRRAGQLLGTPHGYLYLVEPGGEEMTVKVGVGIFSQHIGFRLKWGEGMAGRVWQTGKPLVIDNYDSWSGRSPNFPRGIFHAVVGVPVTGTFRSAGPLAAESTAGPLAPESTTASPVTESIVGAIGLARVESDRTFSAAEVNLLIRFAQLASIALDNARLYTAAAQELAERKRAEAALRHREEYFRSLIENALDIITILNYDGTIRYESPSIERTLGYTPEELLGQYAFDFIHPDDFPRVVEVFATGIEIPDFTASLEFRFRHKDGSWRILEGFGRNLLENAELTGVVVNSRDITERKRAEAEIRQLNEELERRVADRTAQLEAVNKELEAFAYSVSHDLRAPLRALNNYSLFLQEDCAGQLDDLGREYVQGIGESARHMDALVTGLLEYSRIGRMKTNRELVDTRELLDRLLTRLHLREQAEVILPASLPSVRAREVQLEQIFSNLLTNAVKFHCPGVAPKVWIEWADQGLAWEFAVRDNGIGIEKKYFEKIFGIFQRLHTQDEYEGTGIGLAIVKKAVEEHGGQVWVQSTPGQGSVFRFTLPKDGREN